MITVDDIKELAPVIALGALVWRGSSIVGELRSSIRSLTESTDALRKELETHTKWRAETEDRLAELETASAVDEVEKDNLKARIESVGGRRAVRPTEHQTIDRESIARRKRRS